MKIYERYRQQLREKARSDIYRNIFEKMEDMHQFCIQLYRFMFAYRTPPYLYLSVLDRETAATKSDSKGSLYGIVNSDTEAIVDYVDRWGAYQVKMTIGKPINYENTG